MGGLFPKRWTLILVATATLAACGEEVTRYRIIGRVDGTGNLTTVDVALPTLQDLATCRGVHTEHYVDATLLTDSVSLADQGAARHEVVSGDKRPSLIWNEVDGVAVPADVHSLEMLTSFAHFERAAVFFDSLNVTSMPNPAPVYFFPDLEGDSEEGVATDNAAYHLVADGFVLLPTKFLEDLPFPMNAGVIGHEFTHRINYYELWGGQLVSALSAIPATPDAVAAYNRIRSLDEGLADYFGARIAQGAQFIFDSVTPWLVAERDASAPKSLEPDWVDGTQPVVLGQHDPYAVGSVVAAFLWHVHEQHGNIVDTAVLTSMRGLTGPILGSLDFDYGDFERAFVQALPAPAAATACAYLSTHYAAVAGEFAGVCP